MTDTELINAWERRVAAFKVYNALPHSKVDGEPYTPEEAAQWAIIDAAENVIQAAVANTPTGVALQLWTHLGHVVSTKSDELATHQCDLAHFEAQGDTLDWTERLIIAALRSLTKMH